MDEIERKIFGLVPISPDVFSTPHCAGSFEETAVSRRCMVDHKYATNHNNEASVYVMSKRNQWSCVSGGMTISRYQK